jgi:DNA-binding transcriptional LysR family regulator
MVIAPPFRVALRYSCKKITKIENIDGSRAIIASMDTVELSLFVAVAREGSFAGAARELNLDPSAVSRAVASLESQLKVRLFQRTTRQMTLTDAGRLYLTRIAPLVEELDRARDEVRSSRSDPTGVVRVTASVAFGQIYIVPRLAVFRREFPRLNLELILSDANLDLVADRIDAAIRLGPTHRADVQAERLFDTHYRVCASPSYLTRMGRPTTPEALRGHDCVVMPLPDYRSRWLFKLQETLSEVSIKGSFILSTALAVRTAALDGLGPALLPDWLVRDDLKLATLIDLFPDHQVSATTFDTAAWLLYPSANYLPNRVQATMSFLRREFGSPQD